MELYLTTLTVLHRKTTDERIAGCTGSTLAIGRMPDDETLGLITACSSTWIGATSVYTRLIGQAMIVGGALSVAIGWRTNVVRLARA